MKIGGMPPKITTATSGTVSALKLPKHKKGLILHLKRIQEVLLPPSLDFKLKTTASSCAASEALNSLLEPLHRSCQASGPAPQDSPRSWASFLGLSLPHHTAPLPSLPLPSSPRAASQKNLPTPPPSLARQSAGHRAPAGFHSPCSWSPKDFDKSGKTIFKRKRRRGRKRHLTQNLK